MGTTGAAQVTKTGLLPSLQYGSIVTGVTDNALTSWRSLAAAAYGSTQGRSVTARLALEKADPGRQVVVEAVATWAAAWWDNQMDHEVMHDAWRYAIKAVGMSARPNAAVKGGAGAYFVALRRLQWKAPSVHSVCTRMAPSCSSAASGHRRGP